MKNILWAGLFVVAGATPGFAADAVLADPVMDAPPAVFSWSGAYIGLHLGGGSSDIDWEYDSGGPADQTGSGVLGGAQIGYNFQSGNWVFGVEADISAADIDGDTDCPNPAFSCESEIDWLASARLRAGYAFDNLLIYGTGGLGFGDVNIQTVSGAGSVAGESSTETGWTLGAGAEYAFSDRWSLKGEYMYYDLGSSDHEVDSGLNVSVDTRIHTGKIGVNFRW